MHAAFLNDRRMRVKIGNLLSDELPVTGGAVQGSVLGVLDHNAVLESLDEDITDQDVYKYVDDLTLDEAVDKDVECLIESSHEYETHIFKPKKTQESFDKLSAACQDRGLKINDKKTQLLSISSGKNQTKAWLTLKDGSTLYSGESFKLLGFLFSNKPTVHAQVDNIVNRAASRMFVLRHLSSFGADKAKLRNVYCSIARSIMEYSSVTFGPMLTKYQKNRVENIQKKCLRAIYGYGLDYNVLLQMSGLETLEERRERALLKFAQKSSTNPQFMSWFPKNTNRSSQRSGKDYVEKFARSDRLYNSPLYAMRRALNNTPKNDRNSNPQFGDLSHIFNAP